MKKLSMIIILNLILLPRFAFNLFAADKKLNVVCTLPDYEWIASQIGGDHLTTSHIVAPDQDPHFVRPKPSFVRMIANADVLITTGLDLELWLPTIIDRAANARVREGQVGYVAVADGIKLKDKPKSMDRSQGGVHIYGNPHITTSPLNIRDIAKNITIGLVKADPSNRALYEDNLKKFRTRMDKELYGEELVKLMGGATLNRLARSGNLIAFLSKKTIGGKKLIDMLGGVVKKALPLRNLQIITYHKNWIYFADFFGMVIDGQVEPKPAIPPSPKDIEHLIKLMEKNSLKIVFAANYYDEHKIRKVCSTVGAKAVIVPNFVGYKKNLNSYFSLMNYWIDQLISAIKS